MDTHQGRCSTDVPAMELGRIGLEAWVGKKGQLKE